MYFLLSSNVFKILSQDGKMDTKGTVVIEFQEVSSVIVEYLSYFYTIFDSNTVL